MHGAQCVKDSYWKQPLILALAQACAHWITQTPLSGVVSFTSDDGRPVCHGQSAVTLDRLLFDVGILDFIFKCCILLTSHECPP